jgi:type VI secretion system secreted protein VgrG
VKGVHHEKFGSIGMEGGNVNWNVGEVGWLTGGLIWHLKGPGRIVAPSFIIDAPDFQVTNAGSHKEVKGFWDTVHAAWNDTTSHKVAFLTSDSKVVAIEAKYAAVTIAGFGSKTESVGIKMERISAYYSHKGIELGTKSVKAHQIGLSLVTAGLYCIS